MTRSFSEIGRGVIAGVLMLTLPSLVLLFVALELTFTYVIPASQSPYAYFDRAPGILRFDTDGPRSGVYTIGNFAQQRGRWSINNFGWNAPVDYEASSERSGRPLIAIIGDSYIEAFQVDNQNNIASRLRTLTGGEVDVYSFGISGAPLSQYLHMSRYVRDQFDPDIFIVNVVHNDFDESIRAYRPRPYFMQFELGADGQVHELKPAPYVPSRLRRFLGKSAVLRYLHQNLHVADVLQRMTANETGQFNMNVDVGVVSDRMSEIRTITEYTLRALTQESQGRPVVFLLDAPRQDIYDGRIDLSAPPELHVMFADVCDRTSATCLDFLEEFVVRFEETGRRYNTEHDGHWNEVGHQVAAEALVSLLERRGMLARQ